MILSPDDTAGRNEPSAGVRALLNAAQFLMDGCGSLEQDASQSDDLETREYIGKTCLILKQLASDCIAHAEELKEKLDRASMGLEGEVISNETEGEVNQEENATGNELTEDKEQGNTQVESEEEAEREQEEEARTEEESPEFQDDETDTKEEQDREQPEVDEEEESEDEDKKKKRKVKSLDYLSGFNPPELDEQGYIILKSFPELAEWKPRRFRAQDLTPLSVNKSLDPNELTPEQTKLVQEYEELTSRLPGIQEQVQMLLDIRNRD